MRWTEKKNYKPWNLLLMIIASKMVSPYLTQCLSACHCTFMREEIAWKTLWCILHTHRTAVAYFPQDKLKIYYHMASIGTICLAFGCVRRKYIKRTAHSTCYSYYEMKNPTNKICIWRFCDTARTTLGRYMNANKLFFRLTSFTMEQMKSQQSRLENMMNAFIIR